MCSKMSKDNKVEYFNSQQQQPSVKDNDPDNDVRWRALTSNFLGEVSIGGIKYLAVGEASVVRRLIWLTFVLFGVSFMSYQIYDRVAYFMTDPVKVDVRVEYPRETPFPLVTICNENWWRK